jgi:proline racemase
VTELVLESPAGLINVRADCKDGKVTRVTFRNVPAFAMHLDREIDVAPENGADLVRATEAIRHAAAQQLPVVHPENPNITGPTIGNLMVAHEHGASGLGAITVSTGPYDPARPNALTGVLDRSPCGTGTCAKMAVLHAKGLLDVGVDYVNAGPMGTTFTGRIEELTKVGNYDAIIPTLSGQGWIYGTAQYMRDPSDPFPNGYKIGDIWGA